MKKYEEQRAIPKELTFRILNEESNPLEGAKIHAILHNLKTGAGAAADGTPFDFRHGRRIGQDIGADHVQLRLAGGYDHCFDLGPTGGLRLAARATEASSGRSLEVLTDAPGIQFYAGNFLDGSIVGRDGRTFGYRHGFCLEPGLFPDSPNQPAFHRAGYPTGVLRPGEKYAMEMIYRFGVMR